MAGDVKESCHADCRRLHLYLLLALFPLLAALISLYGLVASPATVMDHIGLWPASFPKAPSTSSARSSKALISANTGGLSIGFLGGLAVTLWSANGGIKTMFEAMNIAYGRTEERGFVALNLLTLGFTLGALLLVILLIPRYSGSCPCCSVRSGLAACPGSDRAGSLAGPPPGVIGGALWPFSTVTAPAAPGPTGETCCPAPRWRRLRG